MQHSMSNQYIKYIWNLYVLHTLYRAADTVCINISCNNNHIYKMGKKTTCCWIWKMWMTNTQSN